jgi:hypothetical protein
MDNLVDHLAFCKKQLRKRTEPFRIIAEGAGVSESWVRMLAGGHIPDPTYRRVLSLARYFQRRANGSAR